ncbi:glycine betaine/L-proline ABC transporter ATP-binding protein [Crassaminicella thermophila]|uniref:Quaternary amine transport ATP-binding protein n=1 Tax=Crassaminicella thermophila TaxID=2599308 RepID=A0A5C0SFQ7_CRATE|nr:glycine betaine/L-proline ABC transporter ATP-binding protein [Crassaminicella thermophila]QEK13385.1 glycine betaine/L-proline ABC transporter ATP-binding protein [Crassaminicella thermophila]
MSVKIKVENLTKIFGRNPKGVLKKLKKGMSKEEILEKTGHAVGVNNVSFEVNEGEIFVIMGLSGSGKSTLIRCLNLLNKPTAGKILFEGKDIVKFNKKELRAFRQDKIAMVFQHFGLFSHRTVIENVAYGLEVKGMSKEERLNIANETLKTVGLDGWGDKMPHELSGGMRQRVGLARALANNPDILLMDEPFSALDPLIRRDMQLELLDIQAKLNKTIIFITHDVNEAFKLGDRVAVMKDGKVEQIGTPEEILSNPANEYIENFIQDIDRSKIMQAKHVMFMPSPLLSNKDGLKVAVKQMQTHGISSLFVVNKERKLQGIITIDDTIKAIQEKKTLNDIIQQDFFKTNPETYVQDLIPMAIEAKYPIAVVDETEKLQGIIVRTSVLSGLVS